MSTIITVLSGFGEKAAAAILVEVAGVRILLDAGGSLEPKQAKGWEFPENLDAIVISHDHIDHCRGLSDLHDPVPVYATEPVAPRLPRGLNLQLLPLRGSIEIAGITVTLGQAGHSLGGVWIHLAVAGGIFYSGDYSLESGLFPFDLPPPAASALLDASYGLYQRSAAAGRAQLMALMNTSRQIVLPVPPSGRALEIALWLHKSGIDDWRLGEDCLSVQQALQLAPELFSASAHRQLRTLPSKAYSGEQKIIICGDADGAGGEAQRLMNDKSRDVFSIYTGYLPAQASADVAAGRAQCIRWNVHPRRADLSWLIDHLQADRCLPLFCKIGNRQKWRACISERLIFTTQIQVDYATNS